MMTYSTLLYLHLMFDTYNTHVNSWKSNQKSMCKYVGIIMEFCMNSMQKNEACTQSGKLTTLRCGRIYKNVQ